MYWLLLNMYSEILDLGQEFFIIRATFTKRMKGRFLESVTEYEPHFLSKIRLFHYNHREYVNDPYTVRLSLSLFLYIYTWNTMYLIRCPASSS